MKLLLGRDGITTRMNTAWRWQICAKSSELEPFDPILLLFYMHQLYNSHNRHNQQGMASTLIIDGVDVRSKPKAIRNQTKVLRVYASTIILYIKECVYIFLLISSF